MSLRGRVLVVDDEHNARTALGDLLREEGYTVETAADGFKALPKLEEFDPEIVVTDLKMPGMDGLELMRKVREREESIDVIVMTAYGAIDTAVKALREGAIDYLCKPINFDELLVVLERTFERRSLRQEAKQLRAEVSERRKLSNMVGSSAPMQKVIEAINQVAPSRATVMITGESGTGKELVAAAIHDASARAQGPFVKLHCAALTESLLESELFGHERGSFTGAVSRRDGRFMQAHGGTLFLDEIAEISERVQVKLLRFLQEREFERVGGNQTMKVDVRIIAATHRDLQERVRQGTFREDLYYRLNVVTIQMPTLSQRVSDIPLLAMHFLKKYADENGKRIEGFADDALKALTQYTWPGNVRELENTVERAVVVSRGEKIRAEDLGIVQTAQRGGYDAMPVVPGATLAELERYAIRKTLEHTGGSTSRAAKILGISSRKIQYKLHEYSATEPNQRNAD